jgi:hypothetical protein
VVFRTCHSLFVCCQERSTLSSTHSSSLSLFFSWLTHFNGAFLACMRTLMMRLSTRVVAVVIVVLVVEFFISQYGSADMPLVVSQNYWHWHVWMMIKITRVRHANLIVGCRFWQVLVRELLFIPIMDPSADVPVSSLYNNIGFSIHSILFIALTGILFVWMIIIMELIKVVLPACLPRQSSSSSTRTSSSTSTTAS